MSITKNHFVLKHINQLSKIQYGKLHLRMYHENIIDHYENPRNVGSLDKKSKKVGTSFKNLLT